jgi:hypothetical protein
MARSGGVYVSNPGLRNPDKYGWFGFLAKCSVLDGKALGAALL